MVFTPTSLSPVHTILRLDSSRSRWRQADECTLPDRTGQGQPFRPRSVVSALDLLEFLHQPDGRVARFHEGELFCF